MPQVLPAVAAAMKPGGQLVVLIKPQFEATRGQIGAKGVAGFIARRLMVQGIGF